ncbi:PREDICTED: uncharacterized protein LOC109319559 [Crocodylus porosus]|uniref:uncharacterized protein LOC109319559 n=1 Tax=Crocodylus porosus TaxID=8502 RepID=UPI00093AD214|nr:PREDICTED: uncharacterized protein LOC109319559 [Crocodylus porosus]
MRSLLLLSVLPLLLFVYSLLGQVPGGQVHRLQSSCNVDKVQEQASGSLQESQQAQAVLGFPWMLVYVPVRSCHRVLKDKFGAFSPPTYLNHYQVNTWCNWTIWAGSRKHIIIYVKEFMTTEDCDTNEDKIVFEGVSSLIKNSVVYACWNKKINAFATYAQAVHVVLLRKHAPHHKNTHFKGKYYVFEHQEEDSIPKDGFISGTPLRKVVKKANDSVIRANISVMNDREILDDNIARTAIKENPFKATALNANAQQTVHTDPSVTVLERPVQLAPWYDTWTPSLKIERPAILESEKLSMKLVVNKEMHCTGESLGSSIQTAASANWQLCTPAKEEIVVDFSGVYRPTRLPGLLSDAPDLSVFPLVEPLKLLEVKGPGHRPTIKPTHLNYPILATYSQILPHDITETIEGKNIDASHSQSLGSVTLTEGLLQSKLLAYEAVSGPADDLEKGLWPTHGLTSQHGMVLDHLQFVLETKGMDRLGSCHSRTMPVAEFGSHHSQILEQKYPEVEYFESFRIATDQEKIMLVTAAPHSMLEGKNHLRLQTKQSVPSSAVEQENILASTTGCIPHTKVSKQLADQKADALEVPYSAVKYIQPVDIATDLVTVFSCAEASFTPLTWAWEAGPTELESISFPSAEAFLSPTVSELEPAFPFLSAGVPLIPKALELEPASLFPRGESFFPPSVLELEPSLFPNAETSWPPRSLELEPALPFPGPEASLTPSASGEQSSLSFPCEDPFFTPVAMDLESVLTLEPVLFLPSAKASPTPKVLETELVFPFPNMDSPTPVASELEPSPEELELICFLLNVKSSLIPAAMDPELASSMLEPVLFPSAEASFMSVASDVEPIYFPSTENSLPPVASELEPVPTELDSNFFWSAAGPPFLRALEVGPVLPFPGTEASIAPAGPELEFVFQSAEASFSPVASELEPALRFLHAVAPFPPATRGVSALKDQLSLGTESSHYMDALKEAEHVLTSTTTTTPLPTARVDNLLEAKLHASLLADNCGVPGSTEREQERVFPNPTISQEKGTYAQQLIVKSGREDEGIHWVETVESKAVDGNLLFPSLFPAIKQQVLTPEPEFEDHISCYSLVPKSFTNMPPILMGMDHRGGKQNEFLTSSTSVTLPLVHVDSRTEVQPTVPMKEITQTWKQALPPCMEHPKVKDTVEWRSASPFTSTGHTAPVLQTGKLALREKMDLAPVQSTSNLVSERACMTEMQELPSDVGPPVSLESGSPWLLAYLPIKSCHVILKDDFGKFSPPHSGIQTNIWCNWTIWAGPRKHILIYIKGFQGNGDCDENWDKIIFQGVMSNVERKMAYACKNQGTLIFAARALAVHIVFLSGRNFLSQEYKFKGEYYTFKDYETADSIDVASEQGLKLQSRKTSSSGILLHPKLPKVHSRRLGFQKTTTAPNDPNKLHKLPTDQEAGKATNLEILRNQILHNNLHAYLSQAMDSTTSPTPFPKGEKPMNLGDNKNYSREEKPSDFLKKTPGLNISVVSATKDEKRPVLVFRRLPYRVTIHSDWLFKPLGMKQPKKSTEVESVSTSRKLGPQHDSAVHRRPAGPEDLQSDVRPYEAEISTSRHAYQSLEGMRERTQTVAPQTFRVDLPKDQKTLQANAVDLQGVIHDHIRSLEDSWSNADLTKGIKEATGQLQHITELERNVKKSSTDQEAFGDDNGKANLYFKSAVAYTEMKLGVQSLTSETSKPDIKTESVLSPATVQNTLDVSSLKASSSYWADATEFWGVARNVQSDLLVAEAATSTLHVDSRITRMKEHLLLASTKSYPFSPSFDGITKHIESPEEDAHDSSDLASLLASLENDTTLESQHKPGDILFEVTTEMKHEIRIPQSRKKMKKALLESMKLYIQENLKLSASKVNKIKLKEIKRTNDQNLRLTFWLHLKPEERNISLLLHSQLKELIGRSVGEKKLQLTSLSVEDVNECNSGIGICGDEADCFNGVGTYLCRCKKEYEDHSPTKSGTLCIRVPRSDLGSLFSYVEILIGAIISVALILVVAVSITCMVVKKRRTKKDFCLQESSPSGTPYTAQSPPQVPAVDLSNLGDYLARDPFQPKLRARPPEWTLRMRDNPNEAYRIFVEQSECL